MPTKEMVTGVSTQAVDPKAKGVNGEVGEAPKTYKTQALDATKDYHFVMRTVNQPAGPGTVSPAQLDDDVSMWLSQGYTIHSIHPLGPYMPEGAGRIFGYMFGYHLVRG